MRDKMRTNLEQYIIYVYQDNPNLKMSETDDMMTLMISIFFEL